MAEEIKNTQTEEEVEEQEEEVVEETGSEGSKETGTEGKSGSKVKTFTQEQVTKMMTREKNQGRNAVYKELGINPKDTKSIAMVKALLDSQKTDEQKAAEKESEDQAKIDEANQRALVAEAKAEAMMLGVKSQYVDDVVALALSKMTDDSDLKTIIGEFKTKYAVWFGETEEEEKGKEKGKVGQKGTGSSVKTSKEEKGGKGEETKGLGARLAAQRKSGSKKSSYWGK